MALLVVIVGGILLAVMGILMIEGDYNNSHVTEVQPKGSLLELAEMFSNECERACKEGDMERAEFCTNAISFLAGDNNPLDLKFGDKVLLKVNKKGQ